MERDIKSIHSQMTLEEKASLCSGGDFWHTKAIERLGIPAVMMTDGPHGLRKQAQGADHAGLFTSEPSTCFPTAAATACSWDRELLREIGEALGRECVAQGVSVLLGPGANIKRSPLCGRNFEYFSEDPYLTGEMAAAWIKGIQSMGVGASLKHYAVNNQEYRRMFIDAIVDERALREIYLAGFEAAVRQAQPFTVMCAYNRLDGTYCSENKMLLTEILRDEWGFEGIVVTDWGACNDRVAGLAAGQDLEMPASGGLNDKKIVKAVREGRLGIAVLDRVAGRLLTLIRKGIDSLKQGSLVDLDAHHALARRAAAQSAVLLKNDGGLLPLNRDARVAVIGAFAVTPRYQGSGSSLINPARMENALEEMRKYSPACSYAPGYQTDVPDEAMIEQACAAASEADVAVVFAGLPPEYESEGFDREHMRMPESHNELIRRVAEANPRTVAVLMNGSPVEMPWAGGVMAILEAYLGGQAGGGAVADVLYGIVNPSGKLAETVPFALEDSLSSRFFPMGPHTVEYRESLYVGYRWHDTARVPVLYPFGHGLSYTTFEYTGISVSKDAIIAGEPVAVTVSVKNTGAVAGGEVIQLYVRDVESTAFRPDKELKGFEKVHLMPGELRSVTITLDQRAFAYYNTAISDWYVESGDFELLAGASSADIRLKATVHVESDRPEAAMPDLRNSAPEYYDVNADTCISDRAFEAVYGKKLPTGEKPANAKFSLNSSVEEVRRTLPGRILYRAMAGMMGKMMGPNPDKLMRKMMERFMGEMPLRNLVVMSGGKFPQGLMNFLLGWMNVGRK